MILFLLYRKFAENTRKIIESRGLKQRAVAQKAGFSAQQFSALLNNRKVIKDVDVIAIANALDVTPNDLLVMSVRLWLYGAPAHKEPARVEAQADG